MKIIIPDYQSEAGIDTPTSTTVTGISSAAEHEELTIGRVLDAKWPPLTPVKTPITAEMQADREETSIRKVLDAKWPPLTPVKTPITAEMLADREETSIRKVLDAKWPPLVPVKANESFLSLAYHPDVLTRLSPTIVLGSPSEVNGERSGSRRVLLFNLPPDTTATQVLLGICHGEGLLGVSIVPDIKSRSSTRVANILFENAEDANAVVQHMEQNPVLFQAGDKSVYEPKVWLVPTPTWPSLQELVWLDQGCTRYLSLGYLSDGLVWRALCIVGLKHICCAHYDRKQGSLTLEMTSVRESVRAKERVRIALGYEVWFSHMSVGCVHYSSKTAIVEHVAPDQLEKTWNCWPWNREGDETSLINWAEEYEKDNERRNRALAEALDITYEELPDYLESRQKFVDVEYSIIGSTIKLTRRAWSWSISVEDDHKLLMANTLHDPDWADEWDETFRAEGTPNLRTWERYGMLARHRREKARELGLEEWRVPDCKGECEWGCCDLKDCPVPDVVKRFLEMKPQPHNDDD
ncbi:hypothetical protein CP533_6793 [Ophiocordyceps camponoti-saundersi (nom. inval.)]|nr:hypothetical protein CP533_6793 [Ophiocordyceps camponoti-saundersi (nom. inval.)]